jgi:hypothetical protein
MENGAWGMGHWALGIGLAVRWRASAVVRQRGHVRYPHERLPKGFADLRRLASGFPGRRAPAVIGHGALGIGHR